MRLKDENKKQAIYQSAMTLITEQGLSGVSMSKIAKLAGVSSSTIYTYFDSKEDMLNKLYIMTNDESMALLARVKADFSINSLTFEFYKNWLLALFEFMTANPILFSFKEQFFNSPQVSKDARDQQAIQYQPLFELINNAIEKGDMKDLPIPIITAMLFAVFRSLTWSHLRGEIELSNAMIVDLSEDVWLMVSTNEHMR